MSWIEYICVLVCDGQKYTRQHLCFESLERASVTQAYGCAHMQGCGVDAPRWHDDLPRASGGWTLSVAISTTHHMG